jgi:hypothetical protein
MIGIEREKDKAKRDSQGDGKKLGKECVGG